MTRRDFRFWAPMVAFEKANAPAGQRRRIAGVISTELRDKQGEVLLQRGLDFNPFLRGGWFNDNHSKRTVDVLGYPTGVQRFQKGDRLPDGSVARANATWAEGYLLDTPEADRVWQLAQALAKAGNDRRLGYSVEGGVLERAGPDGKTVAKAVVRNVAITNCPVGEDTRLEALAKSLGAVEKGLTATPPATPPGVNPAEAGDVSGNAGKVLMPQHLEEDDKKVVEKSAAVAAIQRRLGCDVDTAERAYRLFLHQQQQQRGLL